MRMPQLLVALALTAALPAQEWQTIPTSPEEQERIVRELATKTPFTCWRSDDAGNITFVCFNRRGTRSFPEDQTVFTDDSAPGLSDEDFRRILHFPELRGVLTQHQRIGDEGYAVLQAFPKLELAALKNLKNGFSDQEREAGLGPSDAVFMHLDGARGLKIWDSTHSFGFSRDEQPKTLSAMQGFPELEVLIVDVGHANDFEELFPFIQKCPKIRWLKLHRCPFSDDQMQQILAALPELERLEMKPSGNTPGERWSHRSLALIKDQPKLRFLRLIHADALPLPWEDGLEHLVAATGLTHLEFPLEGKGEVHASDIARLMEARPDLQIVHLPPELLPAGEDARERSQRLRTEMRVSVDGFDFDWQIGPN